MNQLEKSKSRTTLTDEWWSDFNPAVLGRFKKFHEANPHVFKAVKEMAYRMRQTGRRRYSIRTILEVIRWHNDLETTGDVFKINNDFQPIFVRLLMHHDPTFEGFFELRRIRSKGIKSEEQVERESI